MSKTSLARYEPITDRLAELWPNCFTTHHGVDRKPLVCGIRELILGVTDEFPETLLAFILYLYTSHPSYLKSVVPGAARVDLNGSVVGTVSENEARHAAGRLRGQERKRARLQAEREQRRQALYGNSDPDLVEQEQNLVSSHRETKLKKTQYVETPHPETKHGAVLKQDLVLRQSAAKLNRRGRGLRAASEAHFAIKAAPPVRIGSPPASPSSLPQRRGDSFEGQHAGAGSGRRRR